MKPHQLAELLNVTSATIRRWAREEYSEFLSPDAQGGGRLHRSFNEHDARIIAWIAAMRERDEAPANITAALKSAQADEWRGLPPLPGMPGAEDTMAMIPAEVVKARLGALQEQMQTVVRERDELKARLGKMEADHTQLQEKYYALTEQLMDLNRRLADMLDEKRQRSR